MRAAPGRRTKSGLGMSVRVLLTSPLRVGMCGSLPPFGWWISGWLVLAGISRAATSPPSSPVLRGCGRLGSDPAAGSLLPADRGVPARAPAAAGRDSRQRRALLACGTAAFALLVTASSAVWVSALSALSPSHSPRSCCNRYLSRSRCYSSPAWLAAAARFRRLHRVLLVPVFAHGREETPATAVAVAQAEMSARERAEAVFRSASPLALAICGGAGVYGLYTLLYLYVELFRERGALAPGCARRRHAAAAGLRRRPARGRGAGSHSTHDTADRVAACAASWTVSERAALQQFVLANPVSPAAAKLLVTRL